MTRRSPILIAGPTGVGKSALAMLLAQRVGGEIVAVDSMQVYRGMDIGTAKPSQADRLQVPHHLIDVVDLAECFDVAWFVRLATAALTEITARGNVPIFCGGTGLYFKALLFGLSAMPAADPGMRQQLEHQSTPELLAELEKEDPVARTRIDPANRRRLIRAVEVIRSTGKPFSAQLALWRHVPNDQVRLPDGQTPILFGLARERSDLRQRIDQRVDAMLGQGLVAEVSALQARGLAQNQNASQALGYKQLLEYLRGEMLWDQTVLLIKQRTRQYARRQMTWFRRQLPLHWVAAAPDEPEASVINRMLQLANPGG